MFHVVVPGPLLGLENTKVLLDTAAEVPTSVVTTTSESVLSQSIASGPDTSNDTSSGSNSSTVDTVSNGHKPCHNSKTSYDPGSVYVYVGDSSMLTSPSPNSQSQIAPSKSPVKSKSTDTPLHQNTSYSGSAKISAAGSNRMEST